jgi:mannose-6-phosphate isomerase-like protein (cupin superfamily)
MQNIVTKGWGFELWIINNSLYCGKQLTVLPDKYCSVHYHMNKDETFYVIDGELELQIGRWDHLTEKDWWSYNESLILRKGDSYHLPPRVPHRFTSNVAYPTTFIEFSTHHEDSDSYRIIKGD